jgi:hypothetical protein
MVLVGKTVGDKPLGKLDVNGRTTLKRNLQGIGWGSWTGLMFENRDRCFALISAVMKKLASIK